MIATEDFRKAIEELAEYETNPISRMRCKRALRNDRIMERWQRRVVEIAPLPVIGGADYEFVFQNLLDWLMENWDEILKILLTILPLFI